MNKSGNIKIIVDLMHCDAWKAMTIACILFSSSVYAQFSPGNLVVVQAGNGSAPLANTGNQIVLREFSPQGISAYSLAIPTTVNPLIIGGSAVSEGGLSISPNGKYLVFAGYAHDLTYTASLASAAASLVNRGIGIVSAAGVYSRIATGTGFYSGNSIRSAASDGNNNYWAAGANAGANYFGINFPIATIQNSITNTRIVNTFSGQLYVSTGSGTPGIYQVGNGFPFTSAQVCTLVVNTAQSGINTASPFAFYFNPGNTVCYVADDRNPGNGGGIQKWIYSAGAYTLAYTLATGGAYGARGVVADFSAPVPKIYATTSEGSFNRLIAINDIGSGATATTLATASANTVFRGLAFSPFCDAAQITSISTTSPVCAGENFTLNTNFSGTAPLTFSWTSAGNFTSSSQNPAINAFSNANYSLSLTNSCGTATSVYAATINPLPTVSVNSATICIGGAAILTASGAATYSFASAGLTNSITLLPATTTTVNVNGYSPQGCAAVATSTILVLDSLHVSVNSGVLCLGDSLLLTAGGAANYTWSTGENTFTITVSPIATTIYTVTGFAEGCPAPVTAISMVTVNLLPLVTMPQLDLFYCTNAPPIPLVGSPSGGTFSGSFVNGNIFDPSLGTTGTEVIRYLYNDSLGCQGSDSVLVTTDDCTGFMDFGKKDGVVAYPNPANEILYIKMNNFSGTSQLRLYNASGEMLCMHTIFESTNSIDLSQYPRGIYSLLISGNQGPLCLKFAKQ